MTTVISLRQARKQRQRAERDAQAQANRARFGRTRAERARDDEGTARLRTTVEAHRLDRADANAPADAPSGGGSRGEGA